MARPVLIGIGGHVVGAVVEQLGAVPGLAARVELHLSPDMPGGRPRPPAEVLARAVVVVAEQGAMDDAERAALAPDCAVITLPRLEFASLWPLMAEHPPRGPGIPAVPAHFGDRIALEVLRAGVAVPSRRAAYDAVAVAALEDLDRLHADMARALFRREAGCDIRVAGFVLSRFRAERLFHSPVHPAGALLHQVMAQLLGHPALAALADGSFDTQLRAVAPGLEAVFANAQAPVHPDVAAHFGLGWWSPGLRYRQGEAVRSFGEWVDWHLREPPRPVRVILPTGPGITALQAAGLAEVATLHPATEITRAAPFFATAINPDIAPQGAALLSADSGRYHVPVVLLALLADAVVLDRSGAVLNNGAVLGDTLARGAPSPVAALPAAHRIEGRGFLGVGPGWRADPHGMATILPRLVACARLRRQNPDIRLLLPEGANSPWLCEMLALLGLEPHVDWLPDAPVACASLLVTSRLDTDAVSPISHAAALALAALVPVAPPGPPLVYLRSAARGQPANEEAVMASLAARGFTLLDADATPLAARIAALRHAAAVVAAQGPALADIAFCPPGAAVLELVGPADPSLTYWSIASCAGLRYGYLVGDAVGLAVPRGAYDVPLAMLDHAAGMMAAR